MNKDSLFHPSSFGLPPSFHLAGLPPTHCTSVFAVCPRHKPATIKAYQIMNYDPNNPLIVQGDRSVLVEVDNPLYAEARDALAPFAELEKSPEHIHTYRVSPLSLWNARAAGMTPDQMVEALEKFSKFDVPGSVVSDIRDYAGRYGRLKLEKRGDDL